MEAVKAHFALNIYRFHFKTGDLKNYHKMINELMQDKVSNLQMDIGISLRKRILRKKMHL